MHGAVWASLGLPGNCQLSSTLAWKAASGSAGSAAYPRGSSFILACSQGTALGSAGEVGASGNPMGK